MKKKTVESQYIKESEVVTGDSIIIIIIINLLLIEYLYRI